MSRYVRPHLDLGTFHDQDGVVIPYGRRWPDGDGPQDTYSESAHPERFAPLQVVGRALLDHLVATYDVTHEIDGPTHRLTPHSPTAASLQMTFNEVHLVCSAGLSTRIGYYCGCDHCDDDVTVLAEELEDEIAAVISGQFREYLTEDRDGLWTRSELRLHEGSRSRGSADLDGDRRSKAALRRTYADVPAWWTAWPPRTSS